MKSKKSIFVVALAALMLIAFTACEQPANVWNPNGRTVTNAVIRQTGEFIEGQEFDPSKFEVDLTYADGFKETISGTNVVVAEKGQSYASIGMKVSASFGEATAESNVVSASAYVNVYDIVDVVIDGPKEFATTDVNKETTPQPVAEVSADDFTVSIVYMVEGAQQTMELDSAYYTLSFVDADGTATQTKFGDLVGSKDGTWYTVKAMVKMANPDYVSANTGYGTDTISFKVVGEAPAAATWDGHSIIIEVAEPTSAATQYYARGEFDTSKVTLYKEIGGKKAEAVKPDTDFDKDSLKITLDNPLNAENEGRFSATAGQQSFTVTFTVTDTKTNVVTTYTEKGTVTTIADYAKTIAAKYVNFKDGSTTEVNPINAGDPLYASFFEVKGTAWASGYEKATGFDKATDTEVAFTMDKDAIPADHKTTNMNVTITYDQGSVIHSDAAKPVTVAVTGIVPAEQDPGA